MRTREGLIRSAEMARVKEPRQKVAKAVVDHIRVYPEMGGGVRVERHHTDSFAHPPKVRRFGQEDGDRFADHLLSAAGMSSAEPEESEPGEE